MKFDQRSQYDGESSTMTTRLSFGSFMFFFVLHLAGDDRRDDAPVQRLSDERRIRCLRIRLPRHLDLRVDVQQRHVAEAARTQRAAREIERAGGTAGQQLDETRQ